MSNPQVLPATYIDTLSRAMPGMPNRGPRPENSEIIAAIEWALPILRASLATPAERERIAERLDLCAAAPGSEMAEAMKKGAAMIRAAIDPQSTDRARAIASILWNASSPVTPLSEPSISREDLAEAAKIIWGKLDLSRRTKPSGDPNPAPWDLCPCCNRAITEIRGEAPTAIETWICSDCIDGGIRRKEPNLTALLSERDQKIAKLNACIARMNTEAATLEADRNAALERLRETQTMLAAAMQAGKEAFRPPTSAEREAMAKDLEDWGGSCDRLDQDRRPGKMLCKAAAMLRLLPSDTTPEAQATARMHRDRLRELAKCMGGTIVIVEADATALRWAADDMTIGACLPARIHKHRETLREWAVFLRGFSGHHDLKTIERMQALEWAASDMQIHASNPQEPETVQKYRAILLRLANALLWAATEMQLTILREMPEPASLPTVKPEWEAPTKEQAESDARMLVTYAGLLTSCPAAPPKSALVSSATAVMRFGASMILRLTSAAKMHGLDLDSPILAGDECPRGSMNMILQWHFKRCKLAPTIAAWGAFGNGWDSAAAWIHRAEPSSTSSHPQRLGLVSMPIDPRDRTLLKDLLKALSERIDANMPPCHVNWLRLESGLDRMLCPPPIGYAIEESAKHEPYPNRLIPARGSLASIRKQIEDWHEAEGVESERASVSEGHRERASERALTLFRVLGLFPAVNSDSSETSQPLPNL